VRKEVILQLWLIVGCHRLAKCRVTCTFAMPDVTVFVVLTHEFSLIEVRKESAWLDR
jgi:hypothetical protein